MVDGVRSLRVSNSPDSPGAPTQYKISFSTSQDLQANSDTISLVFHKEIGIPTSLSRTNVTISASSVSGDAADNQAVRLGDDPTYLSIPSGEGAVNYTLTVPSMDATDGAAVANIDGDARVTITIQSTGGFTNPTEATKPYTPSGQHTIKVSTSKEMTPVPGSFGVPLTLEVDDIKDGRDKPLTITGKGYKGGNSVTLWLDNNRNGMRDTTETDLSPSP